MAKRRSAAALFEVIHADNRFPTRHNSWSIRAPRWFRRREPSGEIEAASVPVAPAVTDSSPSKLWTMLPSMPSLGVRVDPDRQTLNLEMSFTAAMVSGVALLLVLALAYVIGKHNAHRPTPALADVTTDELRTGPAQSSVLDVGATTDTTPSVAMATAPLPASGVITPPPVAKSQGVRPIGRALTASEPKPPSTLAVTDSHRTVGLHYVIVQSYPPEEKALAEEACQLCNKNGILSTVETGLSYAPRWYIVVGITGFDRIKDSAEYDKYVEHIAQVGKQLATTSKFKQFDPKPYKWREPVKTAASEKGNG